MKFPLGLNFKEAEQGWGTRGEKRKLPLCSPIRAPLGGY
jgi:hypothetical protein